MKNRKILIGNSGLIGSTLLESMYFDFQYNSSNIHLFSNLNIHEEYELYLSCLPATKWKVNKDIIADFNNINNIYNVIKQFKYKKVILFSTIDVYNNNILGSNEDDTPIFNKLNYGSNRYIFELMIKELNCENIQIYRLPALFSKLIKKNIIYDLLYNNNIDKIIFNSKYQWYNLENLANDIFKIDSPGTFNLFTEPIPTKDILDIFNINYIDVDNTKEIIYDYKTKLHQSGYIQTSKEVLKEINKFVYDFRN